MPIDIIGQSSDGGFFMRYFSILFLIFVSCNDAGFKSNQFVGGPAKKNPDPSFNPYPSAEPINPTATNSGVDVVATGDSVLIQNPTLNTGELAGGVFVPIKYQYVGKNSGDDAVFTINLVPKTPSYHPNATKLLPESGIKTSEGGSAAGEIPGMCLCGGLTEVDFLWKHKTGKAGTLLNLTNAEFLVSNNVGDKDWLDGFKGFQQNVDYVSFVGADTENPDFISNPEGYGYFRTKDYHPNSIFGDSHKWENRDDIRFAFMCKIEECPQDKKAGTKFLISHHLSHDP